MTSRRRSLVTLAALGGLVLSVLVSATPAANALPATTLTVTTTSDTNPTASGDPCNSSSVTTAPSPLSLRQAVCLANNLGGNVEIDLPAEPLQTFTLSFGELDLGTKSGQVVTVKGLGGAAGDVIDGNGAGRVFDLDQNLLGNVDVTLQDLTIQNGLDNTFGGAGIIAGSGGTVPDSLTLNAVDVRSNHANTSSPANTATNNPGGGLQFIGGSLTITDSTFSTNSAASSPGSAIAYEAIGTSGQGFSLTGSTISNNVGANAAAQPSKGFIYTDGAVSLGGTSGTMSITNSTFTGNTVTQTDGPGRGAALTLEAGTLSVTGSSFTGNTLPGANTVGGAIAVASGSLTASHDRIVGNTAATASGFGLIGGGATITDNWWGCNGGPGSSGCDTISAGLSATPRLNLSGAAVTVDAAGTATVTATLTNDNTGTAVSGAQPEFDGVPVTFGTPTPTGTTCTGAPAAFSGGTATASCTLHGNGREGTGSITATVDGFSTTIPITVDKAPVIVHNPSDTTVQPSDTVTFTSAADGYPTPTVQWQVSTDGGANFNNIGAATSATLSFTAAAAQNGNEYRAVYTNSSSSATTTAATLTVQQAPGITSGATTTFTAGTSGEFDITTSGVPTVSTITATGTLPTGLTFTDNGNGTAKITGTAAAGTGGTSSLGLDASNGVTPDATQTLTISIDEAAAITSNPSDDTVASGTSASFTAAASGFPTPSVQWQLSTNSGASFANISGATSPTLSFTATTGQDGTEYRAVFTNGTGSATTTAATLHVVQAPVFTSPTAAAFTVGTSGTFDITTSGLPGATLSEVGTLPAGLSFAPGPGGTATISGTPDQGAGSQVTVTLNAANGIAPDASQTLTITVDEAPHINSADIASFTVGSSSSFLVTTDRGYPTPGLSESGTLPSGLSLTDNGDGTATLSGTPAAGSGGAYPITITGADGTAPDATQTLTITVDAPPSITSTNHTTFTVGTAGSFTVHTSPGVPAALTLTETGALPTGVTFTDNSDGTGTLSGTASSGTGGLYPITVTASNGVAPDATQSFTLTVDQAPSFTTADHATFVVGQSGTFVANIDQGYPTIESVSVSASPPTGVSASVAQTPTGATITFTGTPSAGTQGTYSIPLAAHNQAGLSAQQTFTLTVVALATITSPNSTTFTAGTPATFAVTTAGSGPPALSESGALPAGVTFVDNGDGTAKLAGTPQSDTGGSYPITITASNGTLPAGTQSFTLTVDEAPAVTSATSTTFASGVSGTFTVTTNGFPKPTLAETGALPPGVTFTDNHDGTATLAGTPGAGSAANYPITITATNGIGTAATQPFTLAVTSLPQTITFTSIPPTTVVVGQTYDVSATGGGSDNPVDFAIDASSSAVCSISGATVTFQHPGSCMIDATEAGNAQYAAGAGSQSVSVSPAATTTALLVKPTTIVATVSAVPPGAGTPSGTVTFSVDGSPVGSTSLVNGVATLTHTVPSGKTHNVAAVYSGSTDFTSSSTSTTRRDPTITATVTSAHPATKYGWHRSSVTVTFHCTPVGAPLTAPCPSPVTFTHNGAGQSVSRTIMATDGGAATATVAGINIDEIRPIVGINGITNGALYPGAAPAAHCVAKDTLSGVASCALATANHSGLITVTATATDKAGNVATRAVSYRITDFYVLGQTMTNGAYTLREGHSYTLVALIPGTSRPRYYDAAPYGQTPHPADNLFNPAGSQYGLHRFTLTVHIDQGLGRYTYWVIGIKTGTTMHLIKFHPVS